MLKAFSMVFLVLLRHTFGLIRVPTIGAGRALLSSLSNDNVSRKQQLIAHRASFPSLKDEQIDQLLHFSEDLAQWNLKINLISRKDIDNLVQRHLIPSLAMSLVHNFKNGETVVDVGTGGGFPGIPLAIACPSTKFTLLDSSTKKIGVVSAMVESLGLDNVDVVTSRAEAHTGRKYNVVLGRAVTSLPEFISWTSHLLHRTGNRAGGVLYMKGGDISEEVQALGLKNHTIHPVADLVSGLATDKFVLHIPISDVPSRAKSIGRV